MVWVFGAVFVATNVFAAVNVAACVWTFGCCVCTTGLANTQLIFCCFFAGDASPTFTLCSFRFVPAMVVAGDDLVAAGFSFKNSSTWASVVLLYCAKENKLLNKFHRERYTPLEQNIFNYLIAVCCVVAGVVICCTYGSWIDMAPEGSIL